MWSVAARATAGHELLHDRSEAVARALASLETCHAGHLLVVDLRKQSAKATLEHTRFE